MRDLSVFWIPVVAILGWAVLSAFRIWSRTRIRELQIRERIAMIEKGHVPPPEMDPAGFDRAMVRHYRGEWHGRSGSARGRLRRVGVTLIGVGFGLMMLISLTGDSPREGIGVGGFLVIFGLAFLINSLFETQHDRSIAQSEPPPAPSAHTPPQE